MNEYMESKEREKIKACERVKKKEIKGKKWKEITSAYPSILQ